MFPDIVISLKMLMMSVNTEQTIMHGNTHRTSSPGQTRPQAVTGRYTAGSRSLSVPA